MNICLSKHIDSNCCIDDDDKLLLLAFLTNKIYIIKVLSFKKHKSVEINIYKRIMSILNRILILTIMYEITFIPWIIILLFRAILTQTVLFSILNVIASGLLSMSICYSMFLMQQYNDDEYKKNLNILYKYNLYHICCCCKSMVIYEMEFDSNENKAINKNNINNNNNNKLEDTLYETNDISVKNEHSNVKELELSIETTFEYAKKMDDVENTALQALNK